MASVRGAMTTHGLAQPRSIWPTTRLGRVAVWLAAANVVLMPTWRVLGPLGAFPGLAAGAAGGIVALVAVTRRGERSAAACAAILPLVFVVLFLAAELLVGHA